jgi:hypothetical protein
MFDVHIFLRCASCKLSESLKPVEAATRRTDSIMPLITRTRQSGVARQETSKIHRQDAKGIEVFSSANPPWRTLRLGGKSIS